MRTFAKIHSADLKFRGLLLEFIPLTSNFADFCEVHGVHRVRGIHLAIWLDSGLSLKHRIAELSKKLATNARTVGIFSFGDFENTLLLIVLLFCFIWNHCLRLNT